MKHCCNINVILYRKGNYLKQNILKRLQNEKYKIIHSRAASSIYY